MNSTYLILDRKMKLLSSFLCINLAAGLNASTVHRNSAVADALLEPLVAASPDLNLIDYLNPCPFSQNCSQFLKMKAKLKTKLKVKAKPKRSVGHSIMPRIVDVENKNLEKNMHFQNTQGQHYNKSNPTNGFNSHVKSHEIRNDRMSDLKSVVKDRSKFSMKTNLKLKQKQRLRRQHSTKHQHHNDADLYNQTFNNIDSIQKFKSLNNDNFYGY